MIMMMAVPKGVFVGDFDLLISSLEGFTKRKKRMPHYWSDTLDLIVGRADEIEWLIDCACDDMKMAIFLDYCNTSCWRYKCQD